MLLSLLTLLLFCIIHTAQSDAVWVHPSPRLNTDSRLQEYPCGQGQYNDFSLTATTLRPGLNTLEFRETIAVQGAPYRIALSYDTDDRFNDFILLDQIPHNNLREWEPAVGDRFHQLQVDIPDVDCTTRNCALQLVQIAVDCAPDSLSFSCGHVSEVFFSCANVNITGTTAPENLHTMYFSFDGATIPHGWTIPTNESWSVGQDGVYVLDQGNSGTTSTVPSTPGDEHWFWRYFWYIVGGGGGVVLLIIGYACYQRSKRPEVLINADDLGSSAYQPMARQIIEYD